MISPHLTRRAFGALAGATTGLAFMPAARAGASTIHGISAFGDLKYPPDFPHFEYVNPDAPKGGLFSTAFGNASFDSFNVFALKGQPSLGLYDTIVGNLIYESLMAPALDEADSYYGLVAENAELADDRSSITFNMRPEARFHDGSPITADDVVFTIEALKTKAKPFYKVLLRPIETVVAEGPNRVRFDFAANEPKRDLPMTVAGLPIFSRAHYATVDFESSGLTPPLTSGPYRIDKFEQGAFVEFARVDDHWSRDLPVNRGQHNFGRIRVDYFRDRTAAFEAFKAGSFRFTEEFWSKVWATGYEPNVFPAIGRGDVVRDTIPDERPSGAQGFWFNQRREIFQDPLVREAIGLAFDFEWSNRTLFYDLYTRTTSFFQGSPMAADGPPNPGELAILEQYADMLPEGILDGPAYVPPKTDGSGSARRAIRRAGRLLDQAGWKVENKIRMKNGKPLQFEFLIATQGFARIIQPMIKNLEQLGVQATLREVDSSQYDERMDRFEFDITTTRVVMSVTPGVELRGYFHSASADALGSRNTGGIKDPVVDALIERAERAESRAELGDVIRALDRVLRSMHVWVPQWSKASHNIAYWDVFNRPAIKPKFSRGVVDLWWLDEEKEAALKAAGRL